MFTVPSYDPRNQPLLTTSSPQTWSSEKGFLWAAIGAAVGLGNLWRFPFMAGENGGSAFVLVYIVCVLLLAIPVALLELCLGREGGRGAFETIRGLCQSRRLPKIWLLIAWLSVAVPFVGLSYYCIVAGWSIEFILDSFGGLNTPTPETSQSAFDSLAASPTYLLLLNGVFIGLVVIVVASGVRGGIERAARWLMPALVCLLVVLAIFALIKGDARQGLTFLFQADFSKITGTTILWGLGQAFFSLAVGVGALITYGAYLPQQVSLAKAALLIGTADTLVAIIAGVVIFPIVFQYNLDPGGGPGLIFVTLPIAFSTMPLGEWVAPAFFFLLFFAAFSSGIAMLEPVLAPFADKGFNRLWLAPCLGFVIWLVSIGPTLSFSDNRLAAFDKSLFNIYDFLVSNIMIPLNGLLLTLFGGWAMGRSLLQRQAGISSGRIFSVWYGLLRYIAPFVILAIFIQSVFS